MNLTIKLFAQAREIANSETIEINLPSESTVADIRHHLVQQVPAMETIAPTLLVAIDNEYAGNETVVAADANIACFPPVSGG